MRISVIAAAAALLLMLGSAASAQLADKRSFFHGFWSNEGFVAQRQVYPPIWKTGHFPARDILHRDVDWNGEGGGLLHERNW
jgi:hypothetical protein